MVLAAGVRCGWRFRVYFLAFGVEHHSFILRQYHLDIVIFFRWFFEAGLRSIAFIVGLRSTFQEKIQSCFIESSSPLFLQRRDKRLLLPLLKFHTGRGDSILKHGLLAEMTTP